MPPHIAQYPFEIVSQRGVPHANLPCFQMISRNYRWDTPFVRGVSTSSAHARGNTQNPVVQDMGVSLR